MQLPAVQPLNLTVRESGFRMDNIKVVGLQLMGGPSVTHYVCKSTVLSCEPYFKEDFSRAEPLSKLKNHREFFSLLSNNTNKLFKI
jgi:hypothetical protein